MSIDLSNCKATEIEIYLFDNKVNIYVDNILFSVSIIKEYENVEFEFNESYDINHIAIYNRSPIDQTVDIDFSNLCCSKLDIYNFFDMYIWLFDSKIDSLKMYNSSILCMSALSTINHMFTTLIEYYTSHNYNILETNISCLIGDKWEDANIILLIGNEWRRRIESNSIINYISPYIL